MARRAHTRRVSPADLRRTAAFWSRYRSNGPTGVARQDGRGRSRHEHDLCAVTKNASRFRNLLRAFVPLVRNRSQPPIFAPVREFVVSENASQPEPALPAKAPINFAARHHDARKMSRSFQYDRGVSPPKAKVTRSNRVGCE